VIVVGDASALKVPAESIWSLFYDGKTRRRTLLKSQRKRLDSMEFPSKLRIANPPGEITASLWKAVKASLKKRTKVLVDGEEDLATLALIAAARPGTPMVYGIPKKGMCFIRTDKRMKAKARKMLGLR
jgi:GTP-dependent dephospho-CoA kinase